MLSRSLHAQDKEKELQPGSFSSGNGGRCLSNVPCAVVVVGHKKRAGRLLFSTAAVLQMRVVNLVVNRKANLRLKASDNMSFIDYSEHHVCLCSQITALAR